MSDLVIHRDRTFTHNGKPYRVMQGSDRPERDGSYFIARVDGDSWYEVVDGFGYMSEIRAYVAESTANGWDLEPNGWYLEEVGMTP